MPVLELHWLHNDARSQETLVQAYAASVAPGQLVRQLTKNYIVCFNPLLYMMFNSQVQTA